MNESIFSDCLRGRHARCPRYGPIELAGGGQAECLCFCHSQTGHRFTLFARIRP